MALGLCLSFNASAEAPDGHMLYTENCTQCHTNNETLFAKQVQYEKSTHRLGGNFERSTTSCAPCHTHQGFVQPRVGSLRRILAGR